MQHSRNWNGRELNTSKASGRWILVLGGTSELGIECAKIFANAGYSVHLAGRELDSLDFHCQEIEAEYSVASQSHQFDAERTESHADFYRSINPKPDVIVCTVGFLGNQARAEIDFQEARSIIETNYVGLVSILNIAGYEMKCRGRGTIIGVSSMAAERGRAANYMYGSAKAGFSNYLSGLRNNLYKSNVHVMTVIPGFMDTRMIAGLATPKLLTLSPEQAAERIFRAFKSKRNVTRLTFRWALIAKLLRWVPEVIFKRV